MADEVRAYGSEEDLWAPLPGITNPGGVLANHVAGNLLHYVGAVLGQTGYLRDRDAEFHARELPKGQLLARLDRARTVVESVVPELDDEALDGPFPDPPPGMGPIEMDAFLGHLLSHLSWHLGQANYHRRIVEARAAEVSPG